MKMVTKAEYKRVEDEFIARTDALCEDVLPELCDCGACPCHDLCEWLCTHNW